jgi:hypothetical protein
MVEITNIYSIGYRCNNDDLLTFMGIRKYSSPFSYMIIDYKTALNYIDNSFNNYDNFKYINNKSGQYMWCNNDKWKNELYFRLYYPDNNKTKNLSDWENICVSNHHNLNTEIDKIKLRSDRLLYNLNNKNETLMLFCIHKIQNYSDDNINNYIDIEFLIKFNNKYDTHLLFIIPLFNYNLDPKIKYNSNKITIIYLNSFYEGNGTAFNDERIKWNEIIKIMNNNYNFNIENK